MLSRRTERSRPRAMPFGVQRLGDRSEGHPVGRHLADGRDQVVIDLGHPVADGGKATVRRNTIKDLGFGRSFGRLVVPVAGRFGSIPRTLRRDSGPSVGNRPSATARPRRTASPLTRRPRPVSAPARIATGSHGRELTLPQALPCGQERWRLLASLPAHSYLVHFAFRQALQKALKLRVQ
jgi:hypothetical protein